MFGWPLAIASVPNLWLQTSHTWNVSRNFFKQNKNKNKNKLKFFLETFEFWRTHSHTFNTEAMAGGLPNMKCFMKNKKNKKIKK
jgi:hypothetical protein